MDMDVRVSTTGMLPDIAGTFVVLCLVALPSDLKVGIITVMVLGVGS
jgi:hypothetical protein